MQYLRPVKDTNEKLDPRMQCLKKSNPEFPIALSGAVCTEREKVNERQIKAFTFVGCFFYMCLNQRRLWRARVGLFEMCSILKSPMYGNPEKAVL